MISQFYENNIVMIVIFSNFPVKILKKTRSIAFDKQSFEQESILARILTSFMMYTAVARVSGFRSVRALVVEGPEVASDVGRHPSITL